MIDYDKFSFISEITKVIELARGKDLSKASQLLSLLSTWLENHPSEWAERQKDIMCKIEAQYGISAVLSTPRIDLKGLSIDEFVHEIKQGVSLVTCCMNRSENLLKAIPTWLQCQEINQIIIVDWGSKTSVRDEITAVGIHDSRILVARVNNQPHWILSYAFNFGFRIAGYDKILKTDADIQISSQFFQQNPLRPGTFLSGDWRTANKGQEHINGFFYVRREDLLSIKGFNEYITTYGWDDDDIYFRLEQNGLNRVRIEADGVYHIPHDDVKRIGNDQAPQNALEELRLDTGARIMGNRFLAAAMPLWDVHKFFVPFTIRSCSEGYMEAEQNGASFHQVSPHIKLDADYYGLVNALSWKTELTVFEIPKERLYALLKARKRCADITCADVRLAAKRAGTVIDWNRKLLLLDFSTDVPEMQQIQLVQSLLDQAKACAATFLVSATVCDKINNDDTASVKHVLPIPQDFYVHQLPVGSASSLINMQKALDASPVLVVRLNKNDVSALVINTPSIQMRRDRLYVHVQHGLGNRLRALASGMAISKATDRELIVIWTPDHHCDCHLSDLIDYDGTVLTDIAASDLAQTDKCTYMEIEPGACKDAYIPLNQGRDLYIRTAYVINNEHSNWESENAALRSLRPVLAVKDLVNSVEAAGRLGVHVRMEGAAGTDHNSYDAPDNWLPTSHQQLNLWRAKSHYNRFMVRIDQLIAAQPSLKVFVAADTSETYQVFHERYGERVSNLMRNTYDRSAQQLRYALADAILLSQCSYMLGSTWSSFSELAQRLSVTIRKTEMSGVDF